MDANVTVRCFHCGREVHDTIHTRLGYRVDYYLLHTGSTIPTTVRKGEEEEASVTYQRIVAAMDVVTCADCYRQPAVRRQREGWYFPGK